MAETEHTAEKDACRCQIVGWSRDPFEPHIPAQAEWEQADDCPVHPHATSAENDAPHLAALLSMHHLEVEPRTYPSYMCSCESWHGAMGDDGGESDGMRDNETGWATHVAERLIAAGYRRITPPNEKWVVGDGSEPCRTWSDAVVRRGEDGEPFWVEMPARTHVSIEAMDKQDVRRLLQSKYEITGWCEEAGTLHARLKDFTRPYGPYGGAS